eukprot:1501738-Pleurochrysis_carterae.AAC.1
MQRQPIFEEFSDRCAWVTSDPSGVSLVERRRLRFAYSAYPSLAAVLAPLHDDSAALILLERLV